MNRAAGRPGWYRSLFTADLSTFVTQTILVNGGADSSTELDALTTLKDSGGISAAQHRKIVEQNPRAFYGLA